MILSVLICTVPQRINLLMELLNNLREQIKPTHTVGFASDKVQISGFASDTIEVLINRDNQEKTTGKKRQELLEAAKGEHICFIDDDDYVYPYYISEILNALKSNPDCVGMKGLYSVDGGKAIEWKLSKNCVNATVKEDGKTKFLRTVNHLSPVRRSIALKVGFPDLSNAEDKFFSDRVQPLLQSEVFIDKLMYNYRYSSLDKLYT